MGNISMCIFKTSFLKKTFRVSIESKKEYITVGYQSFKSKQSK